MKNRVQLFRKAKRRTQAVLASQVGVTRECIDAIEKGRFLPSVALAYNIAAALERYVYDVFPPQGPTPRPCPTRPAPAISSAPQPPVSPHLNRED